MRRYNITEGFPDWLPVAFLLQSFSLIHYFSSPFTLFYRGKGVGDRRQDYHMSTGDIAIIPASINHYAVNKNECEDLFLSLDPQFVAQIAYETINPDNMELVPTFIQSDPLMYLAFSKNIFRYSKLLKA